MKTTNLEIQKWVDAVARLTKPEQIHWCDGSDDEYRSLVSRMIADRTLLKLNQEKFPGCYLHRSHPSDVARVEHLTYVCTQNKIDAGPNNNWMPPEEAHRKMDGLFEGCMQGRTMYIIPYCMGPIDSPYSRCGVEITDSAYVVANMRIMTRMGRPALERIEREGRSVVRGLHSVGDLNPDKRFIMHFPQELAIKSFGSGYGGNALLGKKCHALRIASFQARQEGWLAEHMLILGLESPRGETHYIAAAFPSACGKTNLAMLIPPETFRGYKVWTVGDDIAWMRFGKDGRLYAINPEAGFFGVVPGTSASTNPNALAMLNRDVIFTNVGLTPDQSPWWEGLTPTPPDGLIDWQGRPFMAENGPAAQPNSRFTVSAKHCASYSKHAEDPQGVPISAIIFGGRRRELAPLVYEAKNWVHGVLMGSAVASETTAAAIGDVGVVRRDPMAMKPFCGYNFADYWGHWIELGKTSDRLPKIFHVNWFRRDRDGKFLWPGFGENLRVLNWIVERCRKTISARETPIGFIPHSKDIDLRGITGGVTPATLEELLRVDTNLWRDEFKDIGAFYQSFGDRMPKELWQIHAELSEALQNS